MRHLVILLALALGLAAFADTEKPSMTPPTLAETAAVQQQGRYVATITMANSGVIEIVLEGTFTPYTVANFKKLADAGFYNGLTFHRVEPNFVIQGGDPKANGSGGPGYQINLEISPLMNHTTGVISMARSSRQDSAGSQFFITTGNAPFLDRNYAVFGWVKSGMEVVKNVKVGDVMQTVTIAPYAGTEATPNLADNVQ